MKQVSSHKIESISYLIYQSFVAQIHQRKLLPSVWLNLIRLIYYIIHFRKMRLLGKLVSHFPLSDSHQFKIKLGALSKYLSRSFSFESALPILIGNYRFVKENFTKSSIDQIFDVGLECWRNEIYSIKLIKTKEYDYEGSFALIFIANEVKIYTMAFSFVKTPVSSGNWVIYIARKQGQPSMLPEFRKAAKAFNDNKIVTMVLAATEGMAIALGINSIVGVGTRNQLSYRKPEMLDTFRRSYDEYWETQESVKLANGDYLMPVPMLLKPIDKIPANHRSRTILKRQRRLEISFAVTSIINTCKLPTPGKYNKYSGSGYLLRTGVFISDRLPASNLRIINV